MLNLIKNYGKKHQTSEITKGLFFTYEISANDARERNHQMTNLRDCVFETKKTRILFPRFWGNVTYKNFNFKFNVISASSHSTGFKF